MSIPGMFQRRILPGDFHCYAEGVVAKELAERHQAKFPREWISIDLPELPPEIFGNGFEED